MWMNLLLWEGVWEALGPSCVQGQDFDCHVVLFGLKDVNDIFTSNNFAIFCSLSHRGQGLAPLRKDLGGYSRIIMHWQWRSPLPRSYPPCLQSQVLRELKLHLTID